MWSEFPLFPILAAPSDPNSTLLNSQHKSNNVQLHIIGRTWLSADLLFQIISHRYERAATIITSNRVYKKWPEIFNNDSTLTSALLDRLLHHAETVLIEGKSYRMKDQIDS